jgi:hypothetical protein
MVFGLHFDRMRRLNKVLLNSLFFNLNNIFFTIRMSVIYTREELNKHYPPKENEPAYELFCSVMLSFEINSKYDAESDKFLEPVDRVIHAIDSVIDNTGAGLHRYSALAQLFGFHKSCALVPLSVQECNRYVVSVFPSSGAEVQVSFQKLELEAHLFGSPPSIDGSSPLNAKNIYPVKCPYFQEDGDRVTAVLIKPLRRFEEKKTMRDIISESAELLQINKQDSVK